MEKSTMILMGVPVLIALLITLWLFTLRRIVPTNVVHILQRGKETVSYGVGKGDNVYYHFPAWIPIIGVSVREMPVSNFDIDLHEYSAYDKERLPFLVDVKAFFHIKDTNKAAEKVESFTQLKEQLENVVKGAVRSILAQNTLDEIMEKRGIFGEQFTASVNADLTNWGVESIKNIELMDIKDAGKSTVIQQIMAKKMSAIDAESRTAIAENKMKAENAELDSKQAIAIKAADTEKMMGEAEALSSQAVAIAKAKASEVSGIAQQQAGARIAESAKDTIEKQMEVERTKQTKLADIAKEKAIIESKQLAEQMQISAEADQRKLEIDTNAQKMKIETDAEAHKVAAEKSAEARKISTIKDAEALLTKQENEAKGKAAVGKAEADVILAKGNSEAEAKKNMELAGVTAQTTLAKDIGNNEKYQAYMLKVKEIEVSQVIGVAQAEANATALKDADIKLLINSGDVNSGMSKLSDIFTSKGGSNFNGMIEALKQTDEGKSALEFFNKIAGK